MVANIVIDAALLKKTLEMTKQIDSDEFLVGENWLMVVAQPLNFQD